MSTHSNPTPVVRPEWIVDSVKAQTLLSEEDYLLERLRGGPAQKTIHAFKAVTAQALGGDVIYPAARSSLNRLQQQQAQQQDRHNQQQSLQGQSVEAAESSLSDSKPPAAAAAATPDDREAGGNAAEDEDADAFSFMATSSAAVMEGGGADVSGICGHATAQGGPGSVGVQTSAKPCLFTAQHQQEADDDAVSQLGFEYAVPVQRPTAAAPTWTADDMRAAQAAAAAARSRCDMLKVCIPSVKKTRQCSSGESCVLIWPHTRRALQSQLVTILTM